MTEELLWSPEVRNSVEHVRRVLFKTLDDLEGEKTIVWDDRQNLMKKVNLFTGVKELKDHGVVHNIRLNSPQTCRTPYMVFVLSPTLSTLDSLYDFMDQTRRDTTTLYVVIFIPEASYIVREKLKDRKGGDYSKRLESVKEVPLWWLPRDGDCLSLDEPQLPSRRLINGDWTYIHKCALALNQLLSLVPNKVPLYSKGEWANDVARMVTKMRNAETEEKLSSGGIRINRMIIIDRFLDPLTPLLTQLTFSGLLDEIYGIGMMGSVKVPLMEFEQKNDGDPFEMKEIYLKDEIYHRLRNIHINAISHEISSILTELKKDELSEEDRQKMSVAEYKVLVKKLPEINKRKSYLNTYITLTEMVRQELYKNVVDRVKIEKDLLDRSDSDRVVSFIEDAILEALDATTVLRLIAIHSLTAGGLKPQVLATYRRLVMQSYGIDGVNRMLKMQKMGLLKEKNGNGKLEAEHAPLLFQQAKKTHNLLIEDVLETDRKNPAYAYSGYCSLLVKTLADGDKIRWVEWAKNGEHGGLDDDRTAIFIIGGATRAELALIKQITNVSLVLTSAIITGNVMLENLTRI